MRAFDRINTALSKGGVALLPTETVYGLACRVDDALAVDKIYAIKGRDFDKPLAVCVRNLAQAETLGLFNDTSRKLAKQHWPGSLTIIVKAKADLTLDARCLSEQGPDRTIAFRCPEADWRETLNGPLALTSANRSGDPDCVSHEAAMTELGDEIDADLPTERPLSGAPSTIVAIEGNTVRILRQGALVVTEVMT